MALKLPSDHKPQPNSNAKEADHPKRARMGNARQVTQRVYNYDDKKNEAEADHKRHIILYFHLVSSHLPN